MTATAHPANITYASKPTAVTRPAGMLVGGLFIAATVSAILGLIGYEPILSGPDYLSQGAEHAHQVLFGALMELILVCTAIGTAIGLFPILRKHNERLAVGYLSFRFLEAVIITIGIVAVLSLVTLSQEFVTGAASENDAFHPVGSVLLGIRAWTFMLGPNFMLGINTAMYSFVLYRSGLVPQPLAALGLTGAALVFIAAVLQLFGMVSLGSTPVVLLSLPIAVYEMLLAGWLIARGFRPTAWKGTMS